MKNEMTLTDVEYNQRKRVTRKEEFLNAMDKIIPWQKWIEKIDKFYYHNKLGRKARDIETMLRMYLMQIWFNLSDEGIEDAIYDSYVEKVLLSMNKRKHFADFNREKLKDYETYLSVIRGFQQRFGLMQYNIKKPAYFL